MANINLYKSRTWAFFASSHRFPYIIYYMIPRYLVTLKIMVKVTMYNIRNRWTISTAMKVVLKHFSAVNLLHFAASARTYSIIYLRQFLAKRTLNNLIIWCEFWRYILLNAHAACLIGAIIWPRSWIWKEPHLSIVTPHCKVAIVFYS